MFSGTSNFDEAWIARERVVRTDFIDIIRTGSEGE